MRRKRGGLFQGFVFGPDGERQRRALRPELAEAYRLWAIHEDVREGRSIRITFGPELAERAKERTRAKIRHVREVGYGREGHAQGMMRGDEIHPWRELDAMAAEVAVSHLLGVPTARDDRVGRQGDLVNGDEIRQTEHRGGDLCVYPKDRDEARFWLVTGRFPRSPGIAPVFTIVGWLYGREAKQAAFYAKTPGATPAHWMPQERLRPVLPLERKERAA